MKKIIPIIAAVVVLAVGLVAFLVVGKDDAKTSDTNQQKTQASSALTPPEACDLFSLDDAKKVLGDTAQVPSSPAVNAEASSDDIKVSNCTYETPAGTTIADIKNQRMASILSRGAKTQTGADSNKDYFNGSTKPEGVQEVTGYGDAAFWNPEFGQLNILKGNNWFILQVGNTAATTRTLDDAKKMADVVINKL